MVYCALCIVLCAVFSACSTTARIADGDQLYTGVKALKYHQDSVKLDNTIKRFAEAGLQCIITELDMGIPSTSAENLEDQARNYRVITDIVLNHDNCPSMLIWGIKDNDSWRSASNPLLYTSGLECKPAWYAVRSALRHRDIVNNSSDIRQPLVNLTDSPSEIYDLSGRRMGKMPLKPGIYISNGRKWIIK